jgi:hypothetical protein
VRRIVRAKRSGELQEDVYTESTSVPDVGVGKFESDFEANCENPGTANASESEALRSVERIIEDLSTL